MEREGKGWRGEGWREASVYACRFVIGREALDEIAVVESKFGLEADAAWTEQQKQLVLGCQAIFMTGLLLHAFDKVKDKIELRKKIVKTLAVFPRLGQPKLTLHPCLRKRIEMAMKFQAPV